MILNDIKKDYEACIAARGYKSPAKAAADLGLTRQALTSICDGSHFIRKSAIRTLEQLGYDIRVEFVRNLPESEYVCSAEDEARQHQVYKAIRDSSRRLYTIRYGTISLANLKKSNTDMRSVFSGKYLISAYGYDLSSLGVVLECNEMTEAESVFRKYKKECRTSYKPSDSSSRTYDVTFDIVVLEETLFNENGEIIRSTITKQYAKPVQTEEQKKKNAEYQQKYQTDYREKQKAKREKKKQPEE